MYLAFCLMLYVTNLLAFNLTFSICLTWHVVLITSDMLLGILSKSFSDILSNMLTFDIQCDIFSGMWSVVLSDYLVWQFVPNPRRRRGSGSGKGGQGEAAQRSKLTWNLETPTWQVGKTWEDIQCCIPFHLQKKEMWYLFPVRSCKSRKSCFGPSRGSLLRFFV